MAYQEALEAAGATVHNFNHFGSYQGDWWAKVTYRGETGFVNGSYGSCSGCDSFQAEFDYFEKQCEAHRYDNEHPECQDCKTALENYNRKLDNFGKQYLDGCILSFDDAIKQASKNLEWDTEATEMVEWIKANK